MALLYHKQQREWKWENNIPSPVEILPSILMIETDATQIWPNLRRGGEVRVLAPM
jgi:hypothetical protein